MTAHDGAGAATGRPLRATLLQVAWLAIGLGLAVQALSTAVQLGHGIAWLPDKALIDAVGRVSWATLVCVGLAAGGAAGGGRPMAAGLAGLVAAPAAFAGAKGIQKSLATLTDIGAGGVAMAVGTMAAIAALKAVEYGCLGAVVAWVGRQRWGGLAAHIGAGLGLGVVFGGLIWAVSPHGALQPLSAERLTWAVNEVLFPAGCATILYVSRALGRRLTDQNG